MLAALTSTSLAYAATVGFYQAHRKRTTLEALKRKPSRMTLLRGLSWVLLLLATLVMARATGWELGIPLVLAILCAAGVLSLLCGEFVPRIHWPSGILALLTAALAGAGWLLGGGA
ncbi:MAG: DUF3325 family protein [Pseudomonadota bacterium]